MNNRAGVTEAFLEAGSSFPVLAFASKPRSTPPPITSPTTKCMWSCSTGPLFGDVRAMGWIDAISRGGSRYSTAQMIGIEGLTETVDLLLRWGADETCQNVLVKTAAEVSHDGVWETHTKRSAPRPNTTSCTSW